MIRYNWQQKDWPSFTYSLSGMETALTQFALNAGKAEGLMTGLPGGERWQHIATGMVTEAMKSAEIEGEFLDRASVIASVQANLGFGEDSKTGKKKSGQAMGKLMAEVREHFADRLTAETLFGWQKLVLTADTSRQQRIVSGAWRTHEDAMQIVSGPLNRQRVTYEAPPSERVPEEMTAFLFWFNQTAPHGPEPIAHGPVRAAVMHLYFESIHPFEDGNGRVGRAIAEKALSQALGKPVLFSLSATISANRNAYYEALEQAQAGLDITRWVRWFVEMVVVAQTDAVTRIEFTVRKTRFFDAYKASLNPRQLQAIERMWEAGPAGFQGGMNVNKYVGITKTSKATATRDLQDLARQKILVPGGNARATSYQFPDGV